MAETQDPSTVTNALNALANSVPAKVDGDLENKKATTPEHRYIEFLEEKISRLLREAKVGSVSDVIVSRTDLLPSITSVAILDIGRRRLKFPHRWRR
jgi:hypothetical protein